MKKTTLWDLIKTIISFFFTKREEDKKDQIIDSYRIKEDLDEGYEKIDEEKEEEKKNNKDLNDVQDSLNNMF